VTASTIIGVDPGPEETAFAIVSSGYELVMADRIGNDAFIRALKAAPLSHVAVESIQSYGMPVGRSVFDTCYMIGRVIQVCKDREVPFTLYPRPEYVRNLCGGSTTKDSVLRQALRLRFGEDAKKGDPLYCLRGGSDKRSAFAVAVYHLDKTGFVYEACRKQAASFRSAMSEARCEKGK